MLDEEVTYDNNHQVAAGCAASGRVWRSARGNGGNGDSMAKLTRLRFSLPIDCRSHVDFTSRVTIRYITRGPPAYTHTGKVLGKSRQEIEIKIVPKRDDRNMCKQRTIMTLFK